MNPFQNLKIIELASVLVGPSVGMFFAELGANVVKVENKTTNGDVTRNWKLPQEDKQSSSSAYYQSVNWGKKSIFLDLKNQADKEEFLGLIKQADIILANFKKGSAERLGLGYETIKAINHQIIYANLTAFGENNDAPGFDVLMQAETGFMYMNGEPQRTPVKMPVALIDILAAHQMKEAILIALLERKEKKRGSFVTVSLAKSAIASLANQASNYLNAGFIPQRMGAQHPNIAPYGDIFQTKDGKEIILAIGTEKHFAKFCEVVGLSSLTNDNRFDTNANRVKNRSILISFIQKAIARFDQQTILKMLHTQQVPVGIIRDMKEVFEQSFAKEMILTDKDGNRCVKTVAFDIRS